MRGCRDDHIDAWEGHIMGDKSSQKSNVKKEGKSIKEKRAAKVAKAAGKSATTIPTTGR